MAKLRKEKPFLWFSYRLAIFGVILEFMQFSLRKGFDFLLFLGRKFYFF